MEATYEVTLVGRDGAHVSKKVTIDPVIPHGTPSPKAEFQRRIFEALKTEHPNAREEFTEIHDFNLAKFKLAF